MWYICIHYLTMSKQIAHQLEGNSVFASVTWLFNLQHDVRAIKVEVRSLPFSYPSRRCPEDLYYTHPNSCPIPLFLSPSPIELSEVSRGRASGRTDRIHIHDCLFSSTFGLARKDRTVEASSKVILLGTFLCPDSSPLPLSSSLSLP